MFVRPVINTDYSVVNSVINGCKSTVLNGYHSTTELLSCVKSFFGGDAPTHYPLALSKNVVQHEFTDTTQVMPAVSSENVTQSEVKKSAKEMPSRIANLVQPILELLNRYKLEIVVGAIVLYCDSVGVDGASILVDEFSTENITDLSNLTSAINAVVTKSPELFNETTLVSDNVTKSVMDCEGCLDFDENGQFKKLLDTLTVACIWAVSAIFILMICASASYCSKTIKTMYSCRRLQARSAQS